MGDTSDGNADPGAFTAAATPASSSSVASRRPGPVVVTARRTGQRGELDRGGFFSPPVSPDSPTFDYASPSFFSRRSQRLSAAREDIDAKGELDVDALADSGGGASAFARAAKGPAPQAHAGPSYLSSEENLVDDDSDRQGRINRGTEAIVDATMDRAEEAVLDATRVVKQMPTAAEIETLLEQNRKLLSLWRDSTQTNAALNDRLDTANALLHNARWESEARARLELVLDRCSSAGASVLLCSELEAEFSRVVGPRDVVRCYLFHRERQCLFRSWRRHQSSSGTSSMDVAGGDIEHLEIAITSQSLVTRAFLSQSTLWDHHSSLGLATKSVPSSSSSSFSAGASAEYFLDGGDNQALRDMAAAVVCIPLVAPHDADVDTSCRGVVQVLFERIPPHFFAWTRGNDGDGSSSNDLGRLGVLSRVVAGLCGRDFHLSNTLHNVATAHYRLHHERLEVARWLRAHWQQQGWLFSLRQELAECHKQNRQQVHQAKLECLQLRGLESAVADAVDDVDVRASVSLQERWAADDRVLARCMSRAQAQSDNRIATLVAQHVRTALSSLALSGPNKVTAAEAVSTEAGSSAQIDRDNQDRVALFLPERSSARTASPLVGAVKEGNAQQISAASLRLVQQGRLPSADEDNSSNVYEADKFQGQGLRTTAANRAFNVYFSSANVLAAVRYCGSTREMWTSAAEDSAHSKHNQQRVAASSVSGDSGVLMCVPVCDPAKTNTFGVLCVHRASHSQPATEGDPKVRSSLFDDLDEHMLLTYAAHLATVLGVGTNEPGAEAMTKKAEAEEVSAHISHGRTSLNLF